MVKKTLFQINLTNRGFYSLIAILVLMVGGLGVYAYNSALSPSVMGHTLDEIEAPAGCTAGQILSWSGTGWDCISPSTSGITGSGTANYIPLWNTGGSSLGNSVIYQDASNNIGIGTTSPASKLEVNGDIYFKTGRTLYDTSNGLTGCTAGLPTAPNANGADACTCLKGIKADQPTCTYNSYMSGGNNFLSCVYTCNTQNLGPEKGSLAQLWANSGLMGTT